jgi:YiiM-like, 3-alpha helix domain
MPASFVVLGHRGTLRTFGRQAVLRCPGYDAHRELLRRATELAALPDGWKDYFRKRLWDADA